MSLSYKSARTEFTQYTHVWNSFVQERRQKRENSLSRFFLLTGWDSKKMFVSNSSLFLTVINEYLRFTLHMFVIASDIVDGD